MEIIIVGCETWHTYWVSRSNRPEVERRPSSYAMKKPAENVLKSRHF